MLDKNLFLYDLATVAIFKDEARYLKEWLDYHLLAGVEHFYLYNNNSSDDYKKILAPYVEENLVTLIDFPGKVMQLPAYNDALEKFRFECRYMAFIDLDEFILPKSNRSVVEVVDEILSADQHAAGLAINWQHFGSNGQEAADFSRGVLERFTRRAPTDWTLDLPDNKGNATVKSIVNPRRVDYLWNPHFAIYFGPFRAVNENGDVVEKFLNEPITAQKIVVNHYYIKSAEEQALKIKRGRSDINTTHLQKIFDLYDRNEVFDDGALRYRAARAENFSMESDGQRINRAVSSLFQILIQPLPAEDVENFFNGKLETFLTCRAVAEKFQIKIGVRPTEEIALDLIYKFFGNVQSLKRFEVYLFKNMLPEILTRPFPAAKKILQAFSERTLPFAAEQCKLQFDIKTFVEYQRLRRLLRLIQI